MAFSRNLLSAKTNQAAGLVIQNGGRMTDFSPCCGDSPWLEGDHRRCTKAKMIDENIMMMAITAMKRISWYSMLRVV